MCWRALGLGGLLLAACGGGEPADSIDGGLPDAVATDVAAADAEVALVIADEDLDVLSISPTGRYLVTMRPDNSALVLLDLEGGSAPRALDADAVTRGQWVISQDERVLAYQVAGSLWLADVAGGAPRHVRTFPPDGGVAMPGLSARWDVPMTCFMEFSKDGRWLAWGETGDWYRQYVTATDVPAPIDLGPVVADGANTGSSGRGCVGSFVDDTHLVFTRGYPPSGGPFEAVLIDVTDVSERKLANASWWWLAYDGSIVLGEDDVYEDHSGRLLRARVDITEVNVIADHVSAPIYTAIDRDGRQLAYTVGEHVMLTDLMSLQTTDLGWFPNYIVDPWGFTGDGAGVVLWYWGGASFTNPTLVGLDGGTSFLAGVDAWAAPLRYGSGVISREFGTSLSYLTLAPGLPRYELGPGLDELSIHSSPLGDRFAYLQSSAPKKYLFTMDLAPDSSPVGTGLETIDARDVLFSDNGALVFRTTLSELVAVRSDGSHERLAHPASSFMVLPGDRAAYGDGHRVYVRRVPAP